MLCTKRLALLAIPAALALLALAPLQDPLQPEPAAATQRVRLSVLQYVHPNGETVEVAARDLMEIKLHPAKDGYSTFLELYYENGDYSMIQTPVFHLIRRSAIPNQEITLVRTDGNTNTYTFPKIP